MELNSTGSMHCAFFVHGRYYILYSEFVRPETYSLPLVFFTSPVTSLVDAVLDAAAEDPKGMVTYP